MGESKTERNARFYCNICKKTITLKLSEKFQENFEKKAEFWPFPLIYPHEGHWAVVYLDRQYLERGTHAVKESVDITGVTRGYGLDYWSLLKEE